MFLEEVCNGLEKIHASDGKPVRLSIKTRIGMKEASEFPRLLAIYNHYPLEELIVHPRVREDYYKGKIRMESFAYALEQSRCPVSYNGNLFSAADASALMEEIVGQDEPSDKGEMQKKTKLAALMFGRGAVASPWIFGEMRNLPSSTHLQSFQQFHDRLLTGYAEIMSGDRNTLFKMKELWYYFQCHFPGCEKELKKIKKAQKLSDYRAAVQAMFASGRFVEGGFRNPAP
ncbi:tRNA-dihydrouridine synthase [Clostridium sp. AF02-29]|uniref:tRNA-dihydrouridine synthase n=1 Tax=Clostridium sp. AF02-29 TaxID=2292993 RepID=UPI0023566CFC|nr:tRNA-dihydrouridine synthase [Clostridium sp. AF02-29]